MNRLCIPLNGISILVLVPLLFVTGRIFGQKLCAVQTRDLPCFLTRSKICKFIRVEFPRGGGRVDKWTLSDDGRLISLFPDNQTRSSVRSIVIYDLRREQRKGQWYNEIIIIDYLEWKIYSRFLFFSLSSFIDSLLPRRDIFSHEDSRRGKISFRITRRIFPSCFSLHPFFFSAPIKNNFADGTAHFRRWKDNVARKPVW